MRQFVKRCRPRRNLEGRRDGAETWMASANYRKEACRKARRNLDAHVSGELNTAAELETRAHLKACPACAALMEERLRVRDLLRRAVRASEAPPHLAGSIRAMIRQS